MRFLWRTRFALLSSLPAETVAGIMGALTRYEAATIMCLLPEEALGRAAMALQQTVSDEVGCVLSAAMERQNRMPGPRRRSLSKSPSRSRAAPLVDQSPPQPFKDTTNTIDETLCELSLHARRASVVLGPSKMGTTLPNWAPSRRESLVATQSGELPSPLGPEGRSAFLAVWQPRAMMQY
eukprot:jgi/Botrbrau1/7193/Bobra.0300s0023.1